MKMFRHPSTIPSVVVLLMLLANSACGQKPASPTNVQPAATFSNDDFEIVLGDGWNPESDEFSHGWENQRIMEEVRISVLRANKTLDPKQLEKSAQEALAIRKKIIQDLSAGTALTTETQRLENSTGFDLKFRAEDRKNGVQVCTVIRANRNRIVTFSFNKYQPVVSPEAFEKRCDEVVGKLVVR